MIPPSMMDILENSYIHTAWICVAEIPDLLTEWFAVLHRNDDGWIVHHLWSVHRPEGCARELKTWREDWFDSESDGPENACSCMTSVGKSISKRVYSELHIVPVHGSRHVLTERLLILRDAAGARRDH